MSIDKSKLLVETKPVKLGTETVYVKGCTQDVLMAMRPYLDDKAKTSAVMIAGCVLDEDGKPVFTLEEAMNVRGNYSNNLVLEINALSDFADYESAKKNSKTRK